MTTQESPESQPNTGIGEAVVTSAMLKERTDEVIDEIETGRRIRTIVSDGGKIIAQLTKTTLGEVSNQMLDNNPEIRNSMSEANEALELKDGRIVSADEVFPDEEDAAPPDTTNL